MPVGVGQNAGDVYLEAHLRLARDAGQRLSRQVQTPAMRAGEEASRHFGRKFAAGLAIGGAVIGAGLIKATRLAVRGLAATTKAATDLNETVNKSRVVFGPAFAAVDKFARGSAKALGLSRQEALANAASFGDMFKQIGFGIQPAAKMSKGMVTLAADLASFHNADITQVLEAQQAGFRGEYDSLQRFIPAINAARVQTVAMAMTGKDNAKSLTAQEKAAATYRIMLQDTKDAQGDFLRTSKDNANQQRIAKAQWLDLKAALGQAFLPAQLAVTRAFTEKLLPAGKVFVRELAPGLKAAATAIGTSLAGAVPPADQLARTAKHLGDRLEDLGPEMGAKVGAGVGKLFSLLTKLGPELHKANVETGDLAPTLRLSGAAFSFAADHADLLAKHIPLLVAGFAAYKATQAAANTAALLGVPIRAAEVVATISLARSNRALVASMGERTAATVTLTAAEGGLAASTTAAGAAAAGTASRWSGLARTVGLAGVAVLAASQANNANAAAQKAGASIHARYVAPIYQRLGIYSHQRVQQLQAEGAAERGTAEQKRQAALAGYGRVDALKAESAAVRGLNEAMRGEENAALDLRQAKLNVATAQQRLTGLIKEGRRGSLDYKQAQLDLRRAQIDLKARTDAYKAAQLKANSATGGAMRASQQATPRVRGLGEAARVGGSKANAARIPWQRLGERVSSTYSQIHNKTAHITAKFGWQGLKVFNVGAGGLKAMAAGGPTSLGRVTLVGEEGPELVRFTSPGHVYTANQTKGMLAGGMAAGGPVGRLPRFAMHRSEGFAGALGDWDVQVGKVMTLAARRFKQRMNASFGAFGGVGGTGVGGTVGAAANAWRVFRRVFGLPMGGRAPRANVSDHPIGKAIDIMTTNRNLHRAIIALGKQLPGAKYWISYRQIGHARSGFRPTYYGGPSPHTDHVHWSFYDKGGWLMPGTTVARNRTGRPERILPPGPMTVVLDPSSARLIGEHVLRGLQQAPLQAGVNPNALRTGIREAQRRAGVPRGQLLQ